ncbi:LysR family transcriptional regulator [Plesiocystis pacifica]|uniref:LysR family transcriptional regulator n=1 Tax=Plesiocystis pacifica TaxID=191768 RepID=UPI000A308855|nr:LysR family transcriptional regulator [Plesiocystis pacifica]
MNNKNTLAGFELRHLRHLLALDAHGTLQAAARAIHLSQSALTKSIASLEDGLGTPLFDRSGRRLAPNALHAKVLARARALVRAADDLQREAALFRDGQLEEIRLGVGPVVALGPMPDVLARFRERFPTVRLVIQVGSTTELAPALVEGELHLIVSDREQQVVDDAELEVEALGPDPLAGAVRPEHPLLGSETPTLAHLLAYPRAGATPPARMRRFAEDQLAPLLGTAPTADIRCDNYEVLVSLAETSDMIVLGPRSVLDRYAAMGRLVVLPVVYPSPPSEPAVMLAAGRPTAPAVRSLANLFLGRDATA